jgi:hypothetical protein
VIIKSQGGTRRLQACGRLLAYHDRSRPEELQQVNAQKNNHNYIHYCLDWLSHWNISIDQPQGYANDHKKNY